MNEDPGGAGPRRAMTLSNAAFANPALASVVPFQTPKAHKPVVRRPRTLAFSSTEAMVSTLKPAEPVTCLRPKTIEARAKWFVQNFPGDVLYAVKTNPDPRVLNTLWKSGVRHFDVASIGEVRLVAALFPQAELYFMHPVKSREAIAEAYFKHGVRHFALDTHEELQKILEETADADDLFLHVRLSIPNDKAAYTLAGKFGVNLEDAGSLIRATRNEAAGLGVCFHVGSQCMDPEAYSTTIGYVRDLLQQTEVRLDALDIGGGFPAPYPGMVPQPLAAYFAAVKEAVGTLIVNEECRLLSEPGRALVAEGGSTVVRVELKKGNMLHINDGSFGSLFDAAYTDFQFPVKAIRIGGEFASEQKQFGFYGPTCDSMDVMKGPFTLPADIREGDYIEIGQLGAYGKTMATKFNGFHSDLTVELKDAPVMEAVL